MSATVPLALLARMARREAAALTLVPDLRLHTCDPEPDLVIRVTDCAWCHGDPPMAPPIREAAIVDGPSRCDRLLPELSVLRCEEVTARSLLPLSLIRVSDPTAVPRFRSRAAFWAASVGPSPGPEEILWGLAQLDASERWFDEMLRAFRAGEVPWAATGFGPAVVLPMSTRITRPGGARTPAEVAASRRSLHFFSPHATGPFAAALNAAYLSARTAAVQEALHAGTSLRKPPLRSGSAARPHHASLR